MDKLEKALEKARQQRQSHSPAQAAPRTTLQPLPLFPASGLCALRESTLESHRILAHRTRSAEADIFRILRTQVLQIMEKSGFKTLAITSPHYGDGKTTIALNLAVSIALDLKQTVLLADLDLRNPDISDYLGIQVKYGLTDYLSGNIQLADCLHRLPFERMSILPAGQNIDHSSETLGSPHMAALAEEMRARYPDRLIIYDMPPLLEQDDAIAFLPHVDAVLLVVQDGVTKTEEVKRSLEILNVANVIGTVLNGR